MRAIYNREVVSATSTFDLVPRSLADQRAWLAARSGAFAAIVAVDGDQVIGFGSLSPYKQRAAYSTTVEDSVYVDRERGGEGIGTLLLERLVAIASASGFHAVMARIEAVERGLVGRCTPSAGSSWSASSARSDASSTAGSTSPSCSGCSDGRAVRR